MPAPTRRLNVGTSIPGGYILGRLNGGEGDAGLISVADLASYMAGSGLVLAPGQGGSSISVAAGTGISVSHVGSTYTVNLTTPVAVANGGTGQSSYTDGQLLIGNTTGNTLAKGTLTGGSGISIANGSGSITVTNTGILSLTAGTGISVSGSTINLSTPVSVANGGTGNSTYTDGQLLIGNSATTGLTKATLTAGTNITITNTNGGISIAASSGGGASPAQLNAWSGTNAYSVENYVSYNNKEYVCYLAVSAPGGLSPANAFDTGTVGTGITFTNTNHTATKAGTSGSWAAARSTQSYLNTGKYYFEITINALSTNGQLHGIANSTESVNVQPGSDTLGIGFQVTGSWWTAGLQHSGTWQGASAGDTVAFAVDLGNKLIWVKNLRVGGWNQGTGGTQDPGTGAGGIAIPVAVEDGTHQIFIYAAGFNNAGVNDKFTLNEGDSAFSGTVPTGFANWGGVASSNTTPDLDTSHWIETGVLGRPTGYFYGLGISNDGTTPATKIDIASGIARDAGDANDLILTSTLIKDLASTWAAGNAGGLDTGVKANSTTYHIHLIRNTTTGATDAVFSTSATSGGVTLPTGYAYGRYLWPVMTDGSGNIRLFSQQGDHFLWTTPVNDVNATNPGTAAVLRTLTVPQGIKVLAVGGAGFSVTTADNTDGRVTITSPDQNDVTPGIANLNGGYSFSPATGGQFWLNYECRTNTSGQVRTRNNASGATTQIWLNTFGFKFFREVY